MLLSTGLYDIRVGRAGSVDLSLRLVESGEIPGQDLQSSNGEGDAAGDRKRNRIASM